MGDLLDVAKLEATDIVTERPQYLTDVDIQKLEGGQNVLQQHIKHLQAGLGTVKKHRETRYEGQCLRLSYLTDQLVRLYTQVYPSATVAAWSGVFFPLTA